MNLSDGSKRETGVKLVLFFLLPVFAYVAGLNLLFPTTDSEQYKGFYENLYTENNSDFELGFYLSARLAKNIFRLSYYQFIVIYILIGLFIKFKVLSGFRNFILIYFFYFIFLFYFYEALVVRAAFAHALALYSLSIYPENKKKSFLVALLSGLFHTSMFLFILPILFYRFIDKKINITRFFVFCIITAIIAFKVFDLLLFIPRFGPYFYNNPDYFNIWGTPLIFICLVAIMYLISIKEILNEKSRIFLYSSVILVSFSLIFFKFSLFSIRLLDLSHLLLLVLLVSIVNKRRYLIPATILSVYCSYLFFSKVLDGPSIILQLIKN